MRAYQQRHARYSTVRTTTTTRARTDKVLATPVCRPLFPFRLQLMPWNAMASASLVPPGGGGSGGCARGPNTSGRPSRWPWRKRCTTQLQGDRRLPGLVCGQESLRRSRLSRCLRLLLGTSPLLRREEEEEEEEEEEATSSRSSPSPGVWVLPEECTGSSPASTHCLVLLHVPASVPKALWDVFQAIST